MMKKYASENMKSKNKNKMKKRKKLEKILKMN